jgi:ribosomal protein S18 acetylase RimI-like enzyme
MNSIRNWFAPWWKKSAPSVVKPEKPRTYLPPPGKHWRLLDVTGESPGEAALLSIEVPLVIRPYAPSDEAGVQSYLASHPDCNWFHRRFAEAPGLHHDNCLIAEANAKSVGFVLHTRHDNRRRIHHVFVLDAYRRLGIGTLLLRRFVFESVLSSAVHTLEAIVPANDRRALDFLLALHFKTAEVREMIHEDTVRLTKILDCPGEGIRGCKLKWQESKPTTTVAPLKPSL